VIAVIARNRKTKTLPLINADDADLKLPKLPVLPKLPRLKIEADRSRQQKFQLPAILEGSSNVAALQFWQSWQSWQFWQLIVIGTSGDRTSGDLKTLTGFQFWQSWQSWQFWQLIVIGTSGDRDIR